MSKKGKGDFQNRAAKKFADVGKIDLLSESEIYNLLNDELDTILLQITENRAHRGKFPVYAGNMFANISSAKYIEKYARVNADELEAEEKESLKLLIAQGFKDSVMNRFQAQSLENQDRNDFLRNAFAKLASGKLRAAKKLKLDGEKTKELIIQVYLEPKYGIKQVCRLFDASEVSDKKKLRIFSKLYGKRTAEAMGATLCVDTHGSGFVGLIFNTIMKSNKKKRLKYLRHYAETFKKLKRFNFLLKGDFFVKNKRIIKKLIKEDHGYKKAFDFKFGTKSSDKKRDKGEKDTSVVESSKMYMGKFSSDLIKNL